MEYAGSPLQTPRDLEQESLPVGPATRMIMLEADAEGKVVYLFGKRRRHTISLPGRYARAPFLMLESVRWTLLLEPKEKRLMAIFFPLGLSGRTVLLGPDWGKWVTEEGALKNAISVPELLYEWNAPLTLYEAQQCLGIEFQINFNNREIFTPNALLGLREGPVHYSLELQFGYPFGGFRLARVKCEDERTSRVDSFMDLVGFPLVFPEKPAAPPPPPPPPPKPQPQAALFSPQAGPQPARSATARPAPQPSMGASARAGQAPPKPGAAPRPAAPGAPVAPERAVPPRTAGGPAPAALRPLPPTEQLPTSEMLAAIAKENDPARRWQMIEANLLLARPERTYQLIARYPDLIGERAAAWAPPRLKTVFTRQPGSVMIGLMEGWTINQVLALAEGIGEPEKIMAWLREREIDRLLKLDLSAEPASVEQARRALRIDRHADEATIKKTWRILLGFMNADLGRSEERPIHRKKDEIAKHLQAARNFLIKQLNH